MSSVEEKNIPYYVNYVTCNLNGPMQECVLTFAQMAPLPGNDAEGQLIGKMQTRVTMNISVLKQLHGALGRQLQEYESTYGEVRVAPAVREGVEFN